jgi:hypothetical protein
MSVGSPRIADARSTLARELGPQERLLWSGTSRPGLVLRAADGVLIPFSLLVPRAKEVYEVIRSAQRAAT